MASSEHPHLNRKAQLAGINDQLITGTIVEVVQAGSNWNGFNIYTIEVDRADWNKTYAEKPTCTEWNVTLL